MIEHQKVYIVFSAGDGRYRVEVDGSVRDEVFLQGSQDRIPLLQAYPSASVPPSPPHGTWAGPELSMLYVEKRARERPWVPQTDWLTGG